MADQRIVDLPIKTDTGISLADYLLGIDSAEGYQMLISDLAKKIVETYIGSSLAGTTQTLKSALDELNEDLSDVTDSINNSILYIKSIAVSATTGDIASVSNSLITSDHVVAEAVFANPAAITSAITWTTSSGSLVLNGTCVSATTVNIVLIKKYN